MSSLLRSAPPTQLFHAASPIVTLHVATLSTPLGALRVVACSEGRLRAILFPERSDAVRAQHGLVPEAAARTLDTACVQLTEYFARTREHFELVLGAQGTPFQLEVWSALAAIPYAKTRTYKELAAAVGSPRAMRAVGAANGRNPLPIVLPCHRVIGHDGNLTGYAGGLSRKRALLALEASR